LTDLEVIMTTTTIELLDELRAQAEALAATTGRSLAVVLTEAVAQGLAYDRWFRAEVEEVETMWERLTTAEASERGSC
jgi:predicted transcriptional regulator